MHPVFTNHVVLRNLENYIIYDYKGDEIYNLDDEAFHVTRYFTGKWNLNEISRKTHLEFVKLKEFSDELLEMGIIIDKKVQDAKSDFIKETQKPPFPSLRNILIHITLRCNLKCVHCYIGEKKQIDLPLNIIKKFIPEFYQLQGLRILVSGGEPLLHPQFKEIIEYISQFPLRIMLLTNGTLITPKIAEFLKNHVYEIQISIDGIESHNEFRADKNAYNKAINAIQMLKNKGISIEVATMIHKKNINELNQLSETLKELNVDHWSLDIPVLTGDFIKNRDYIPDLEKAVNALKKFGWGGCPEEEINEWACGSHVCSIMPNGDVAKCQFFSDKPVGNLKEISLLDCWKKIQKNYIWKKKELQCNKLNCPYLEECRGGCRYRAFSLTNDILGIDKIKCISYGFSLDKTK